MSNSPTPSDQALNYDSDDSLSSSGNLSTSSEKLTSSGKLLPSSSSKKSLFVHRSLVSRLYHSIHIDYGYRKPDSIMETFMTLFTFHNETMNIWSHLIGFVCVVIAGISISVDLFNDPKSATEVLAVESYIVCAAICLFFSSLYHWFGCFSEECHNCLLRLDLSGIALLTAGSFLPGMYYGFYCRQDIQPYYMGLVGLVLVVGMIAPWIEVRVRGINVSAFIFAALVSFGVLPFAHWLMITPVEYTRHLVTNFVLMFFWYGAGFTVYVARIPEAFFPKR